MNEDRAIVDAVLAREAGAFEALVQANERLVWHLLLRMVARREEAEELCQEVFLKVFQQLHGFRFGSALSTWIGRIAFSVGSRHLRRRQLPLAEPTAVAGEGERDPLAEVADGLDLQQAVESADEVARLNAALDTLPALQRTVVSLYHLDELPIQQIAEITGLPEGTIKSHLFRARRVLRERLQ